jgi:hypothetical protein
LFILFALVLVVAAVVDAVVMRLRLVMVALVAAALPAAKFGLWERMFRPVFTSSLGLAVTAATEDRLVLALLELRAETRQLLEITLIRPQ